MKKKNKLLVLGTSAMIFTLCLVGCGGNETSSGSQSTSETSQGTSTSGGTSSEIVDETGIFETKSIAEDLTKDADGKPQFDEEVTIKMWSIIGDPDQVVFDKLVRQFNDEFMGEIKIDLEYKGHFDYYTALENQWANEPENFPDVCFMHNEKTVEYAYKGYLYPLDTLFEKTGVQLDLSQIYSNIDRVTQYKNHRFAVPVDAHGFVTSFRQDVIKKNNLGFDNNTRFIPNSRAEYGELLTKLRQKADEGTLLTRNLNRGQDHSWVTANKNTFYPSFTQSTDPDGLSALYANGGRLLTEDQSTVVFHQNKGFQTYLTDQVERWNAKLIGESGGSAEMFGNGNTVMFSEGPWYVSQTYTAQWNNSELRTAGQKGVTEEDATDPVYSAPYTASRPTNWWTLDENANTEDGKKWFGNGHAVSVTRHCNSMQKVAAAMKFIEWYTQGADADTGNEHLATWCTAGHVPAWKNVYDSEYYKKILSENMTCRALGDPANIIALEGLEYESTAVTCVADSCNQVISALKSSEGCTTQKALQIANEVATSTQEMIDMLRELDQM